MIHSSTVIYPFISCHGDTSVITLYLTMPYLETVLGFSLGFSLERFRKMAVIEKIDDVAKPHILKV